MKPIKYCIVVIFCVLNAFCGKKYLDVPDTGAYIRQAYVKDLKTTTDFLEGIYVSLGQNFYYGYNQIYPDLIADNIKLRLAASADLAAHYNWNQLADDAASTGGKNMNYAWLTGYQIISSCNFVLDKVVEYRDQNPAKADNMKAQALALRAFVHFMLVNIFAQPYGFTTDASHAGIPYITNYDWTTPASVRNSVGEVYTNILNDLQLSVSLFADGDKNVLFMNKNAVKGLLARVYLFKGDFQSAKNWARDVSSAVPIMPAGATGYPSKLFTTGETEALFQLMPSATGISLPSSTGSYSGTYYTYFQGAFFITAKKFIATADIANTLKQNPNDLRKNWVATTLDINKYPSDVVTGFSYKSGAYYATLLRSSEMYLTAAEAYGQLKNEDSARYYLNQIRTRAGIPEVAISVAGSGLMDSIYLERRRELAFEGLRMFDLLRWKKGVSRQDAWSSSVQSLPYPSNKAIAPLPQNDVNIAGLSQNLDY